MLFHTTTFLVFFIVFLMFYLPVRKTEGGVWVILVFSNIFYGWWNWKFLGLLWATIIVDYTLASLLDRTEVPWKRRCLLLISLFTNLGILWFFKYWNFFLDGATAIGISSAASWHILDLALPVGISFYVFQSMSYTLDVYRREHEPIRNPIHFAAFVCFFPHMVAGPIQRIDQLMPQIVKPAPITPDRVISGGYLFCIGLFRKAIADTLATFVDPVFNEINNATPAEVVFAIFGFGLQIYLDFTGYVDMARGISRILGIELMLNFKAPYTSTSPREFWRRWHISLSQWLRDYLYISLGGNRHGELRHLSALMITMLLGGLWHGAGLNFIIWGGLHGLYLILNVLWDKLISKKGPSAMVEFPPSDPVKKPQALGSRLLLLKSIRLVFGWLVTFLAVNYAWLYFRAHTFETSLVANKKIFAWISHPMMPPLVPGLVALVFLVMLMELALRFRPDWMQQQCDDLTTGRAIYKGVAGGILFISGIVLLAGVPTQQFIYFQF
jgi:alginate O-acetyltransferase complex protein AlgI